MHFVVFSVLGIVAIFFIKENGAATCGKNAFKCKGSDQCIKQSKICDGKADCADRSDESSVLCSARKNGTADCKLPPVPKFGKYNISFTELYENETVKNITTLIYSCPEGLNFFGKSGTVRCQDGVWYPEIPTCTDKCKPLSSKVLLLTCYADVEVGSVVDCNKPLPQGAVAIFSCNKLTHVKISEPKYNKIKCEESKWNKELLIDFCEEKSFDDELDHEKVDCPPLRSTRLTITCQLADDTIVPCNRPLPLGTKVFFECSDPAFASVNAFPYTLIACEKEGKWSRSLPEKYCPAVECPPLKSKKLTVTCQLPDNTVVPCNQDVPNGTRADFDCSSPAYLKLKQFEYSSVICRKGKWDKSLPEDYCGTVCGQSVIKQLRPGVDWRQGDGTFEEFPWHVAIYLKSDKDNWDYTCDGSIISQKVVITAAHCIATEQQTKADKSPDKLIVVAGKYRKNFNISDGNALIRRVENVYTPEEYLGKAGLYKHDIGFLILEEPFDFNSFIMPVCLDLGKDNFEKDQLVDGAIGNITGLSFVKKKESDVLKVARMSYVPKSVCLVNINEDLVSYVLDDKFCAGNLNSDKSICPGDGGGIVFYHTAAQAYYLRGMLSLGDKDCQGKNFNIFTRVSAYGELVDKFVEVEELNSSNPLNLCHPPYSSKVGFTCLLPNRTRISCNQSLPDGSIARFRCIKPAMYSLGPSHSGRLTCRKGKWDDFSPEVYCKAAFDRTLVPEKDECEPLNSAKLKLDCRKPGDRIIPCNQSVPDRTKVYFQCSKPSHAQLKPFPYSYVTCEKGKWDKLLPEGYCKTVCGKSTSRYLKPEAGHGRHNITAADSPWHATIYLKFEDMVNFMCEATIISPKAIITRPNCLANVHYGSGAHTNFDLEKVLVAAGKIRMDYWITDEHAQFRAVEFIYVPDEYRETRNFYLYSIAFAVLKAPFDLNAFVMPVCLDLGEHSFEEDKSLEGTVGYISSLSFEEDLEEFDSLQVAQMPYVPRSECHEGIDYDFRQYLLHDKFCAGNLSSEISICRSLGDGLVFYRPAEESYYLEGIAVIGGKWCRNTYNVYTKVSTYWEIVKYFAELEEFDSNDDTLQRLNLPIECLPLNSTILTLDCQLLNGTSIPCDRSIPVGTVAHFQCNSPTYVRERPFPYSEITCEAGQWDSLLPEDYCITDVCQPLKSDKLTLTCVQRNNTIIPCDWLVPVGTKAHFQCFSPAYLSLDPLPYPYITCEKGNRWDKSLPEDHCKTVCGKTISKKLRPIIGNGQDVNYGEFPWHVAIYFKLNETNWAYICGGSIISHKVVITAAHCIADVSSAERVRTNKSPDELLVAAGKYHRDINITDEMEQVRAVEYVYTPEMYLYMYRLLAEDIGFLVLIRPFQFNAFVRPVCLDLDISANDEDKILEGSIGNVTGWGLQETSELADVLKLAQMPYVPKHLCVHNIDRNLLGNVIYDKFCAGNLSSDIAVCKGDSGGGIVFYDRTEKVYYLRGIVSSGPKFCNGKEYNLFTRITSYRQMVQYFLEMELFDLNDLNNQLYGSNSQTQIESRKPIILSNNKAPMMTVNRLWDIPSTTPVGTAITRAQGFDEENDTLAYALELKDREKRNPFVIDGVTGIVTLQESLEKRVGEKFLLYITVTDGRLSMKMEIFVKINKATTSANVLPSNRPNKIPPIGGMLSPPVELTVPAINKTDSETTVAEQKDGCPSLFSKKLLIMCVTSNFEPTPCTKPIPENTRVIFRCNPEGYLEAREPAYDRITCRSGKWDMPLIDDFCRPECGRPRFATRSIISNGSLAESASFPWHAGIYRYNETARKYEQICGGTLISNKVAVTAAHCLYFEKKGVKGLFKIEESTLKVGLGKYYRDLNAKEDALAQIKDVQSFEISPDYTGSSSLWTDDIAFIVLKTEADYSLAVQPVCVDDNEEDQLMNGAVGKIVGWGLASPGVVRKTLTSADMTYFPRDECISKITFSHRQYVSKEKICAGDKSANVKICPHDSGGGLVFKDPKLDAYYLRGVISLGSKNCKAQKYALFTRISLFKSLVDKYLDLS